MESLSTKLIPSFSDEVKEMFLEVIERILKDKKYTVLEDQKYKAPLRDTAELLL